MKPVPILAANPATWLAWLSDDLRLLADHVPILTACRLRVHAEELAAEAIRLKEGNVK